MATARKRTPRPASQRCRADRAAAHCSVRAARAGVAYGELGTPLSGMGVAVGDYDNDGREDLHLTNFSHQPNSLFRNEGSGQFESVNALFP